jgi:SAM-dependent methyltransferase
MASDRKPLPPASVRGRVRGWIDRHAGRLGDSVLEIGSRQHVPGAWWLSNRDLARGDWLGIDMQPGPGVDEVADIHALPAEWSGRFSGVLCSEVLEHVRRPWVALPELRRVLRPGGTLIVTTLTAFPIHGFPDDYYRYTESGLRALLEDAGFVGIETAAAGEILVELNDHGEPGRVRRLIPMHVFAVAEAPAC